MDRIHFDVDRTEAGLAAECRDCENAASYRRKLQQLIAGVGIAFKSYPLRKGLRMGDRTAGVISRTVANRWR